MMLFWLAKDIKEGTEWSLVRNLTSVRPSGKWSDCLGHIVFGHIRYLVYIWYLKSVEPFSKPIADHFIPISKNSEKPLSTDMINWESDARQLCKLPRLVADRSHKLCCSDTIAVDIGNIFYYNGANDSSYLNSSISLSTSSQSILLALI